MKTLQNSREAGSPASASPAIDLRAPLRTDVGRRSISHRQPTNAYKSTLPLVELRRFLINGQIIGNYRK